MDALDFVLEQLFKVFHFLRNTEIFGLSLFKWISGLSVISFFLDIFVGGGDGSAD